MSTRTTRKARIRRTTQRAAHLTVGELLAAACDIVGTGPDLGLRVSQLLSQGPVAAALCPRLRFG